MNKMKNEDDRSEKSLIRLDSKRREFIKKSTLMGVGVIASSIVPAQVIASVGDEKSDTNQNRGYQLTQHVADYYKSAAS